MQWQTSTKSAAVLGVLLAFGLLLSGIQLKEAVMVWKRADRVVSVKGLAERNVKVDLVLWPLSYTVSADSLENLHATLSTTEGKIRAFLLRSGFDEDEISTTSPEVADQWSMYFGENKPAERYRAEAVVLLRTSSVDEVKAVMNTTDELVKDGVLLSRSYEHRPQFIFTGLNEIKPEMIAEATKDARRAAMQFAEDSGSKIGKIRSAQQGYFSIEDLDSYTPDIKKIRVVTTVEYLLLD
ncbi:MAG: SIMPL domain-containing protein [Limnochordia bacterium]|jgi:hypothetical protein|nr:SIMPL domain-containing protein [Limnochordia bacterium]MDD2630180.1 SIMPL domain-containing protein [Limnochordia bacterium]MDD4518803.1 SIMPL domain-containing protein [Limnochordia bacterium]